MPKFTFYQQKKHKILDLCINKLFNSKTYPSLQENHIFPQLTKMENYLFMYGIFLNQESRFLRLRACDNYSEN